MLSLADSEGAQLPNISFARAVSLFAAQFDLPRFGFKRARSHTSEIESSHQMAARKQLVNIPKIRLLVVGDSGGLHMSVWFSLQS